MTSPSTFTDYWNGIISTSGGMRAAFGTAPAVVMTGDSRAEIAPYDTLGGARFFPLGMPGIAINEGATYCPRAVNGFKPQVCVVQVGINLCYIPLTDPQWETVAQDTTLLLQSIITTGAKPILTLPIPEEAGHDPTVAQRNYWLNTISWQMAGAAIALKVPYLDTHAMFMGPDGNALPGTTFDGIHPSPATFATMGAALSPMVASLL